MAKRKKTTFSSTEDIRNELKNLYELDSEGNLENYLAADEAKSIKDLSPDSIEFKKRINNENFNYFIELSEIYSQEMLAVQQFMQGEIEKQTFLEKYFNELERSKEIFQKLIARETGIMQPLQSVQLERLQRVEMRIGNGINFINQEIKFWESAREELDNEIATLKTEKGHIINQAMAILQDYAANITSSDVFVRVPIALTLTPEEKEKLCEQAWSGEVKLEAVDIQGIANSFAEKVGSGEVSYLDQAEFMHAEVKGRLHEKIKQVSDSFLTGDLQTNFVERNMKSVQAKTVVHQYVDMISQHFSEQDSKHGNQLKLNAVRLGENDGKINAATQKREKVNNIIDALSEQKKSLQATREGLLAACQNKSTSLELSSEMKNSQSALTSLMERMAMVEQAHVEFGQDKEKEADETLGVRNKAF